MKRHFILFFTMILLVMFCANADARRKKNPENQNSRAPWSTTYSSYVGQCTWFVDGRVKQDGWNLKFSPKAGNGYQWWDEVQNAKRKSNGNPGDIMVFDKKLGGTGHVAYVTSSGNYKGRRAWTVRHANWNDGNGQTAVDEVEGVKINQCTFVSDDGGVKIILNESKNSLSRTTYKVTGFLQRN